MRKQESRFKYLNSGFPFSREWQKKWNDKISFQAAQKETKPAPVKLEKFSGSVEKVDEVAKAIVVKGKVKKEEKTLTIATDDKTKITKAGKDVPFGDLKQGVNVSVEYKKDGDKMTAVAIKVAVPKAAAKKEEPKK